MGVSDGLGYGTDPGWGERYVSQEEMAFMGMSEPRPFAGYRNYFGSHYPRNRSYQKIIRNEYDEPSAMRPHQAYRMRDIYHEDHGVSDDTRKLKLIKDIHC